MKIKDNREWKKFSEIKVGNVFFWDEMYFLKLSTEYANIDGELVNCFNISENEVDGFCGSCNVIAVNGTFVVED